MSQVRDEQRVAWWRASSPRRPHRAVAATLALAALCACAEGGGDEELNAGLGSADAGTLPAVPPSSGSGATDIPPSITPPATTPPPSSSGRSDASTAASDAGSAKGDASTSKPDASASGSKDAGSSSSLDLDGLLGGLFGDGGTSSAGSSDGGFTPPPMGGGAWKLDDGSFVDCPPEPPPIPIIGGLCAGVYFTCNWTNQSGEKYFCTCDWVHWLCI